MPLPRKTTVLSLLAQKRTFRSAIAMSALPPNSGRRSRPGQPSQWLKVKVNAPSPNEFHSDENSGRRREGMSALPLKADIRRSGCDVRFVPLEIYKASSRAPRPTKSSVQSFNDLTYFRSCERIVNILPVAPRFDEIVGAQACQLLRHCRLTKTENLLDLGHRLLTFDQQAKNDEACFVRQRL